MAIEIISKERGDSIVEEWVLSKLESDSCTYEFTNNNEGSFIFRDGDLFITIENYPWTECYVEEFYSIEEAISWLS